MARKRTQRLVSFVLVLVLCLFRSVSGIPYVNDISVLKSKAETDYGLRNPRVTMQKRDCIYFGNYWQEDTNGDGVADRKDEKTPIKWQILKQDGDDLFLLADQVLDGKKYNEQQTDVTWETCTLRSWLNSDFYDAVFSASEKKAIKQTLVSNEDNPYCGTKGGNDTTDRLFLLSLSETMNTDYGFQSDGGFYDQARHTKATDYAKAQGCGTDSEGTSCWWLRSPGFDSSNATYVNNIGFVSYSGISVYLDNSGVRPALHVNAANAAISSALGNKTTKEVALAKTTWDTVEFGAYNGTKIQWRVLSVDGNDAFLLADRILLEKEYNEERTSVTWETSTLRKWLNDDFYKEAFTSAEQTAINKTTLINEDNPFYGTEGGNKTEDSVYLLSLSDIVNPSYGFPTAYFCASASRQAVPTNREDARRWWLRSPDNDSNSATYVIDNGDVGSYGYNVYNHSYGVRPALHLNLSSSVWIKGEEITCVDREIEESEPPLEEDNETENAENTENSENANRDNTNNTQNKSVTADVTSSIAGSTNEEQSQTVTIESKETESKKSKVKVFTKGNLKYKITKTKGASGNVTVVGVKSKKVKNITIPTLVIRKGVIYYITAIGTKAFMNCKKLKKITFKSKKIAKMGKQAFRGVNKEVKFLVPKSNRKKYAKMIKKAW